MSETTNYGLYINDDNQERFLDWRNKINGINESNMVIIDRVLGEKADNSGAFNTTLLHTAWTGVQAPFIQTILVEDLGENQNGTISVAHNATFEQREAAREAMLCVTGQSDGTLTISADGEMPDIDIPVVIILLG